jgi:hypothetical protein
MYRCATNPRAEGPTYANVALSERSIMLKSFTTLGQDNSGIFARVISQSRRLIYIIAVLICSSSISFAQSTTIRIQFLNGKNGKPLRNTPVVINRNTLPPEETPLGTLVLRTDRNGIVNVQAKSNELIWANPERSFGRSCQTNDRYGPRYETGRILQEGIVEENLCGAKLPRAQSGLLVLAFRRSTFIEALGEN